MYMILYKVKASRLLFIHKVQNLTCPHSLRNAHSGSRGWCAHTLCITSQVQNHPAREQLRTHWDEIDNKKEVTILLCLSFFSAFIALQHFFHLYLTLFSNFRLHTNQVSFLLSNALRVTRPHSPGLIAMCLVQQGQLWPLVYQWMLTLKKPVWWEKMILTNPEIQAEATSKTWFSQSLLFSFSVKKKTKTGSAHRAGSFVHEWLDAQGLYVQWRIQGRGPAPPPPPPYFKTKLRPEVLKIFFSHGLDDRPLPPNLKA